MIATESSCLTPEQLRDVAGGRLPAHRFSRLLEHLDSCPECQNRAEAAFESDDSLAAALAAPSAADPHAAEPDCVAALHRAANRRDLPADRSSPPVDQLGPYKLIRPLGSGGMGAVFLAEHTRLRRRCAIKLLPRDRGFDAAWRDRFDREMAAVAALDDPHVVSASDAGEAAGWHFLVMEYLDGLDLSRLAGRLGPLGIADACELVRQAAVGLAHIHASGLVHRDIKPSNLMLTRGGVVKILDLGLVLSGTEPLPSDNRLTTVGHLMGTLAYMAPEQLVDSTAVDHRADLYALGATLYRLLAGVAPHAAARGLAPLVIAKTAKGAPAISEHRSDLPGPLVDLVTRLLDPDPKRRPQTAAEVAKALEPLAATARPERLVAEALRRPPSEEESIAPAPLVAPQTAEAEQPPRRRRFAALSAAAALPLLLLAGIVITIQTDRGDLVIESDQPGLAVSVEQGEETVEELRLETGENRVTLRSGTYTVTLDGPADGMRLSDSTAAITRGGETILRVRREESRRTAPVTTATDAPRYRGQPFDHWLAVLEHERDVESVIEAMRAVIAIGKDDGAAKTSAKSGESESFRAAAAVLRAARRFGGMSRDEDGTASQRFMEHFFAYYPALLPNPGLEAISEELAAGNRESAIAAISLLYSYARESITYPHRPDPGELDRWSETQSGREKLQTLSANLDSAVERLGGYRLLSDLHQRSSANFEPIHTVAEAYRVRVKIGNLLGIDLLADEVIGSRVRKHMQDAADHHQRLFNDAEEPLVQPLPAPSTSHWALDEEEVEAARSKVEPVTLAWAAIPLLLTSDHASPEAQRELFDELVEAAPTATADAIIVAIHKALPEPFSGGGMGGFGPGGMGGMMADKKLPHYARQHSELWQHALEHAAEFTSRPRFALQLFPHLHLQLFEGFAAQPQTGEITGVKPETGEMVSLDPEMRQLYDAMQSVEAILEERAAAAASDTEPDANGGSEEAEAPADPGAAVQRDNLNPRYVKYAERIISRSDKDDDKVLTEDERKEMIIDMRPADADRDGRITVTEYAAWLQARSAGTTPPPSASNSPRYRGQSFGEWLAVLENERDVETVTDAMRAVSALSKDGKTEASDRQRDRAAAAMLRAARRIGGMMASDIEGSQPSPRFMKEFLQSYPALLPNPGLEAISKELAAGSNRSYMAAIWMLANYATQFNSSTAHQPEPDELERWSESEKGREKLRTLSANLHHAVERLGGYQLLQVDQPTDAGPDAAVRSAYLVGLVINRVLGVDSLEDPVLGSWLRASIENAADYHQRLFAEADPDDPGDDPSFSPSAPRPMGVEIEASRGHFDSATLAWAAVPHLLRANHTLSEAPRALLHELMDDAPLATADAIVVAAYQSLPGSAYRTHSSGLPGLGRAFLPTLRNSELWQPALEHAARVTGKPRLALQWFIDLKEQTFGGPGGEPRADNVLAPPESVQFFTALQSAIKKLEERAADSAEDAETDVVSEVDGAGREASSPAAEKGGAAAE